MKPSEIKKIAEEYVNDIVNRMGIPKDYVSAETRKGLRYDCEPILQWLSERFYLVEKDKVEQELISALKRCRNQDHYDGAYETLQSLFGPGIRKEEEE